MPLAQLSKCFLAIHDFTAFCLAKRDAHLGGNISAIISQPSFVFMQDLNRLSDEFIGRIGRGRVPCLLGSALPVQALDESSYL